MLFNTVASPVGPVLTGDKEVVPLQSVLNPSSKTEAPVRLHPILDDATDG